MGANEHHVSSGGGSEGHHPNANLNLFPDAIASAAAKSSPPRAGAKRKFQVCNGYLLEFDQLARVLSVLQERKGQAKVSRDALIEDTGLSNRQIESLVSVGAALGLILPGKQILSPVGALIAQHDIFMERTGTLEWCHFQGAGSARNLIWWELFNRFLPDHPPASQDRWMEWLRAELADEYTDRTIGKHLYEEVRFVADAYLERKFKKLELLHRTSDGLIYRRRYANPVPEVFASLLYQYGVATDSRLFQLSDLATKPGAPGLLFAMDASTLRGAIGTLHTRGWVRHESTHNLDQVRLKDGFTPVEFLAAYYEDREPKTQEVTA